MSDPAPTLAERIERIDNRWQKWGGGALFALLTTGIGAMMSASLPWHLWVARLCFMCVAIELLCFIGYSAYSSKRTLLVYLATCAFAGIVALGAWRAAAAISKQEALMRNAINRGGGGGGPPADDQVVSMQWRWLQDMAEPDVLLVNESDSPVKDLLWTVLLWRNDYPDKTLPLQIPVQKVDWIKSHDDVGPFDVFGPVRNTLQRGERLSGIADVECLDCTRSRIYVLDIKWRTNEGWYCESTLKYRSGMPIPTKLTSTTVSHYIDELRRTCLSGTIRNMATQEVFNK